MKKNIAKIIARYNQLQNQKRVFHWLLANKHDSELALIIAAADEHNSLDDLLRFMAWAIERGLIPTHNQLPYNDTIPF